MRGYAPELPNVTFDRDLIIHDKAQELRLLFRGRAHTSGDVYVWSPSRKVIATGDVLHGFLPFIGDGYPKDWPNTLLKIAELDFQHVIGGHGSVQHTRGPLQQMAAYIDELTDIVSRNFRKPLEQIQQMAEPATMTSLRHGYGDFLVGEAKKFGRQEGGPAEFLRAGVRTNVADVHKALARG
ncbi:MAG: hypothetical protein HYS04_14685 [Acidobacteria bacterium]|nr:hypothetical protein [Acidobacteriota bacterium]